MADFKVSEELIALSKLSTSTTDFEMANFILGAQISPHRVVKQFILESGIRIDSINKVSRGIRKKKIEIKQLQNKIEAFKNDDNTIPDGSKLDVELLEIDIENLQDGLIGSGKTLEAAEYELKTLDVLFTGFRAEHNIEELTDPSKQYSLENDYWAERLAKQAYLDVVGTGRIGSGNVEAILNLPGDGVKKVAGHMTTLLGSKNNTVIMAPITPKKLDS